MERNRKVFKRLFPPDLFALFIDVGHYNTSLAAYTNLVQHFEGELRGMVWGLGREKTGERIIRSRTLLHLARPDLRSKRKTSSHTPPPPPFAPSLPTPAPLCLVRPDLSSKQKAGVSAALDDISADKDSTLRSIRGYVILEMLGKGAYGAVYKARRLKQVWAGMARLDARGCNEQLGLPCVFPSGVGAAGGAFRLVKRGRAWGFSPREAGPRVGLFAA
eukprot:366556-Chlamydomonas_euryale.AAC.16